MRIAPQLARSLASLALVAGGLALAAALPTRAAAQARAVDVRKNLVVTSAIGGKCLNVEGGRATNGARIIGYPCSGAGNEQFWFNADGSINHAGKCLVVQGGRGNDGDQIILWDCNGGANEKWKWSNGKLVGQNGKCLDLKGGNWQNLPLVNQPVILYRCNGGDNQSWAWSAVVPRSAVPNAKVVQPGAVARIAPIDGVARVVSAGGANVVSGGGANVIAPGGGNVISVGGGNVVAAGGMN